MWSEVVNMYEWEGVAGLIAGRYATSRAQVLKSREGKKVLWANYPHCDAARPKKGPSFWPKKLKICPDTLTLGDDRSRQCARG